MEYYSKRDNIEIQELKETTDESVKDLCKPIFRDKMGITHDIDIVRCHRLGNQNKPSSNKETKETYSVSECVCACVCVREREREGVCV